jgi:uncharacterized protein YfaS (alpha-2-macroglobulin family)
MKIQAMQLYNGAFCAWPNSGPDRWSSVYAAHFLAACEKRGIKVPRETLKTALGYLRYLLASEVNADDKYAYEASLAIKAYITYVLTLSGEEPLGWMSSLKDKLDNMPPYGRILLAAAYAQTGDTRTATGIVGEKAPAIAGYDGKERLNFDSPLRTTALHLIAWNAIDPSSASAVMTAADLLRTLNSARWYTTQEAGWTILALADFYSYHREDKDAILELSEEKTGVIAVVSGDKSISQNLEENISRLSITNSGGGTGYAAWTADGIPTARPKAEDSGMKATVKYTDKNGYNISGDTVIHAGERIYGKITIDAFGGELKNIVVALPLAGGFEIENPRLTDPSAENEAWENNYEYYYQTSREELRDDRLLLFVDHVWRKFEWNFTMRAVTPGTFTLPPIAAECMYSPGTRSVGETSAITIK